MSGAAGSFFRVIKSNLTFEKALSFFGKVFEHRGKIADFCNIFKKKDDGAATADVEAAPRNIPAQKLDEKKTTAKKVDEKKTGLIFPR